MKILILTGKFGMGHWSASHALQELLERDGHEAETLDLFDCALPELAPAIYRGFNLLVTYGGGIYNLFHRMTRDVEGDVPLARQFINCLENLLMDRCPDVILSTHPVCSGVVARYKEESGVALPLVTCITDVTCHSEWIHPGTDYYLVASLAVRDGLAAKGVDSSRIVVTGIPVGEQFAPARQEGRRDRELLVMGGGLGLMPRKDSFYRALNDLPGVHTTILTGRNEKLYHRLKDAYPNIEAVPFTNRVNEYMGRADLMLTKPGGITIFEAIASRLPLLAWEPFLEQERENARFLVRAGMARVVSKEEGACLRAIRETIYHDVLLAEMRQAMDDAARTMCRAAVCAVVRELAGEGVCA